MKASRTLKRRGLPRLLARTSLAVAAASFAGLPTSANCESAAPAPSSLAACAACHGPQLQGDESFGAPNLSVLSTWYVERQMRNYKRGLRAPPGSADIAGLQMQPMAAVLDEAGILSAAQLVETVGEQSAAPTVEGDAARGATLYRTCAVCHGERAQGNQALNAPRLAGQSDWYLVSQLQNYRAGIRGVYGDIWGAQMRASTGMLANDAAIIDVAAYINTLAQHTAPEE